MHTETIIYEVDVYDPNLSLQEKKYFGVEILNIKKIKLKIEKCFNFNFNGKGRRGKNVVKW
jgi:hypothetical protein